MMGSENVTFMSLDYGTILFCFFFFWHQGHEQHSEIFGCSSLEFSSMLENSPPNES